jgi:branched-chain amino acid transport system permease protein
MTLLGIRGLSVAFGGLHALDSVDLEVRVGEIHALIGPNGSGKSTLLNAVGGLVPASGEIRLDEYSLSGRPAWRIHRWGVGRTFQVPRLFESLNVEENVMAGWRRDPARARHELARAGLQEKAGWPVSRLSAAERRFLEMARACAGNPRVLLLDEPAAGLSGAERGELFLYLQAMPARGISLLLVEHDMKMVTGLAHRVTALHFGRKIAEGDPEAVARHPAVVEAYLGKPNKTA